MITQKVRPDNGSREGKWVALTIAGILACASVLMPLHQVDSPHSAVLSHQIRITDLHQEELGLIAELKLAHEELRDLHAESGTWPDTEEMASLWIAPLFKIKTGSVKVRINGRALVTGSTWASDRVIKGRLQ